MLSRLVQPTAIRLVGRYGLNSLNKYQQIRYNTTTTTTATVASPQISKPIEPTKTVDITPDGVIKWEDIPKPGPVMETVEPYISGAIIPLSQLNFVQYMFFPFTLGAMYYMDYLLNYMPWWGAIVGTTVTFRLLYFPVMLILNKQAARTHNILPQSKKLQTQLNDAMADSDSFKMAIIKSKLDKLNIENRLTIKHRLPPMLAQAPMYASVFVLLRSLTGYPAEGLTTGGALWFTNLTLPDPYFILPLITSTSMLIMIETSLKSTIAPQSSTTKYIFRIIPVGMFAFIYNFPAATLLFWTSSNMITLGYTFLFRHPWIRDKLKIPARLEHPPELTTPKQTSLKEQYRSFKDRTYARQMTSMDLRVRDDLAFRKSGAGPVRKTYKQAPE